MSFKLISIIILRLKFKTVILGHALKNAMNPVVTSASGWLASLLAGAVFVEYIFDIERQPRLAAGEGVIERRVGAREGRQPHCIQE